MANEEHLALLKQGVMTWNAWRDKNPRIQPDLSGTDLVDMDLMDADFSTALLARADLSGANLSGVHLRRAHLSGADFTRAHLSGADFTKAHIGWTVFGDVDLSTVRGLETVEHSAPSTRPKPNTRVTSRKLVSPVSCSARTMRAVGLSHGDSEARA
jgi:hypothetical protein